MSFPPHMPMITPMSFFSPVAPRMIPSNMSTAPPGIPINGTLKSGDNEKKNRLQAVTTVFVGSISDRAPDVMIKRMLQHCGSVVNWRRVQDAHGKLQAFGFCEYENPEGTLRCIRLLNGLQIQDKKLVVKFDAKTKALLDEYKKKKRHELAKKAAKDTTAFRFVYDDDDEDKKDSNSIDANEKKKSSEEGEIEEEVDDYTDDETRHEDFILKQSIETIMREYAREMNLKALETKEQAIREAQMTTMSETPNPTIVSNRINNSSTDPTAAAAADNDEQGKRNLISSEIQMFRDRFKDEDTKMRNTEKERKERYERERVLQREKCVTEEAAKNKLTVSPPSRDRSSPRREHNSSTTNRRDRSSPNDDRYRSSSSRNNTSNSIRSRTGDRYNSPSSRLYNNRRSRTKSPNDDHDDEDSYEQKKQERRLRDKEFHYRERLKIWEQRERRKDIEYQSEKQRELARLRDEEKEGKRLLAFLDDYNDEIHDPKYYKGTTLAHRLKHREYEIEIDHRDRYHEKEEIEQLRQKLLGQNNINNIELEIKQHLERQEELIRKSLIDLIRITSDESDNEEKKSKKLASTNEKEILDSPPAVIKIESPKNDVKFSPPHTSALDGVSNISTKLSSKRKLVVNEIFRDDQDDDNMNKLTKQLRLSAIPDQQSTMSQNSPEHSKDASRTSKVTPSPVHNANVTSTQLHDEKRQTARKLIENIPTKKEDLFAYSLDWSLLDSNLIEKRIKPWVTKKIVEYLGEEEPALVDFICTSIISKKNADFILADIRVVLDDEAEVFVVKMWRLIVYEIEAKRNGLSK